MFNRTVRIGNFAIANNRRFVFIGGPCAIESMEHALMMAKSIKKICDRLDVDFIFKSSFDKANRTSIKSGRGIGIDGAVEIFKEIKKIVGCPIVTDFHMAEQYKHPIVDVVDMVQVPAFLCRQTDLLEVAAKSGKVINVKKGQFLSPRETHYIYEKFKTFGNENVILCDRGTSFGYNTLINDMMCYPIMAETGCPVCCDCTHSVQRPGAGDGYTLGNREMAEVIARAAVAVGVAAVFAEVHNDPEKAPCDGTNMLRLDQLERVLTILLDIDKIIKKKANSSE
ncbi:MAG: 3-deoxy-8-phosphooctulonate synthase [Rickettsiales bacterium]|jgi:2-dehydro-3-deoxyphosphooctonate aldolase (KDO 8-P synthase)|nr:3-deoxy-8-phosphooctulonate synthase [Rickettsiales bacterium]